MYVCDGVEIDFGVMGYWMGSIMVLFVLLVDVVCCYMLVCGKVYVDDILLLVLVLGNGCMKIGCFWVYVCDDW